MSCDWSFQISSIDLFTISFDNQPKSLESISFSFTTNYFVKKFLLIYLKLFLESLVVEHNRAGFLVQVVDFLLRPIWMCDWFGCSISICLYLRMPWSLIVFCNICSSVSLSGYLNVSSFAYKSMNKNIKSFEHWTFE